MKSIWFALLVVCVALPAQSAVTKGVTALVIMNQTEFLIAADALTNASGTERDAVKVRAVVTWNNDALLPAADTTEYQFRLLAGNAAANILTESGATGTIYRFTNTVSVPGTLGGGRISRTNSFSLKPFGQLSPHTPYSVELTLIDGAKKVDTAETAARQFWHFTNLVSGDAALNVLGDLETNGWQKTFAIETVPGQEAFQISNRFRLYRFDDFNDARTLGSVSVRLSWQLQDTDGMVIPTFPTSTNFSVLTYNYDTGSPETPFATALTRVISVHPLNQLDSVSNRYRVVVTMSLTNVPGQPARLANSATTPAARLLHYNGTLRFGEVTATLTNLIGVPNPGLNLPGASYLNAELDGQAVFQGSTPQISFDLVGPRNFRLRSNGEAELSSGTISVPSPLSVQYFTNGNVRLRRTGITLSADGAVADFRFFLPAGFGVSTNYNDTRILESQLLFNDVGMDSSLEPRTNIVRTGTMVASTESKPVYFVADRLEWNITSHSFRLTPNGTFPIIGVRMADQRLLNSYSNSMVSPALALKRANDGYYQYVRDITGLVIVTATPGNVAQVDFTATFDNGSFSPHFPAGPTIAWTNGGSIRINNNAVMSGASSRLEGVQAIIQQYISSCLGCDGTTTTNPVTMTPTNRYLNFTRDGGLVGVRDTALNVTPNFSWGFSTSAGSYAHRANAVRDLTFLMSGHFLQGSDNPSSSENGPGILHLTGVAGTNLNVIERPFSNGYDTAGRADYAGINGRSSSPAPTGLDTLTGTLVPFTRTARSKYYVRFAGVSGIHEAVPGSFDNTLTMLGYPFTFDKYGFSFLDSQNVESRTDGSVSVPLPSLFTLPFKELRLTCAGGLESAQLPAGTGYRRLDYWNADILPQSIRFESQPGQECDPTQAYLVLGVRAHASYVNEPLSGTMGFFANGSIIPPHFGLPGVQSRFELPSQFRFSGPAGSGDWVLTPVLPAYFTTNDSSLAANGYLNLVGELNVPFFEGIKVQLHTGARTNDPLITPSIRLAGGWPRAGENNVNGWKIGNDHYFNDADFDDLNRGFPAGVNIETYVNSSTPQYRAVAQRTWLDVIDFKYALHWDPALRYFRSTEVSLTDLFVVQAPHQLTYLDPQRAIIDVGVRYDGLPVVTLTHFLADADGNSAASAMRNAIQPAAYTEITNGLATADGLLSENPSRLLDAMLASSVDQILTNLMTDLVSRWNTAKANGSDARNDFRAASYVRLASHFFGGNGVTQTVRQRLLDLGSKAANGPLAPTLSTQITQVANGIGRNANSFDGGAVGARAIRNLVQLSAPQFNANVAGPELEAALNQNAPAFNQLRTLMLNAQNGIASRTSGLADGSSEWAGELDAAWNAAALPLRRVSTNAFIRIATEMLGYNWRIDDPLVGPGAAQMQARMRAAIVDYLVGEPVIAAVRTSIKQRLFDLNENYRSAANSLFAQYNFVARDLISRSLAAVDNNYSPGLGILSDSFAISRLQGHAEIEDDSLRELRLDSRVKLKVPDDMAFNAFLEIKEQNSENTPEACLPPNNQPATEIKFGATDVELDWISDGLRATVGTKINLVSGNPTGFAGSLETTGPLAFAGFVIKKIGFALAFGQQENYLAANARVKMGQSVEIAGGVFFGRACDLDPLIIAVASVSPFLLADVNPKNIFGEPPFTGGFVYGEGTFPVFSLGCLFEVRLTAGAGGWFFVEGPKFGGIIKAGISGTVICVLSVSGDITLIGAMREGGMTFAGLAHVEGCFGIWPLEFCVDADTSVQYTEGKDWDADEP
jgi:hypothetical protein